jgi:ubiquitin C-terminal hydrolase
MQGELKYDLYGVVEHSGLLPNYGHYVCTIRSSPSTWYLMNDSHVRARSNLLLLWLHGSFYLCNNHFFFRLILFLMQGH